MNAPVKANYANIESFQGLLTEDFIVETRNRQDLIHSNKQTSNTASQNIRINCQKLSEELNQLKREFAQSTNHFDKVAQAGNLCANNLFEATKALRKAAESIKSASEKRKHAAANN